MSRRIFKYSLPVDDSILTVEVGLGPVLHVAMQYDTAMLKSMLCFWLVDDSDHVRLHRRFQVVGTGHFLPPGAVPVGSTLDGPFVWHLLELP